MKKWIGNSIFFRKESELSPKQKWVVGLFNLSSVVVFWVLSSFLVSDLFEDNIYRKPFFITYINTVSFIFYLLPYFLFEAEGIQEFFDVLKRDFRQSPTRLNDIETVTYGSGSEESLVIPEQPDLEVGIYETVVLSLQFCALWFSANLVTNYSLSYTSVASQTILSSTSSFFTLMVGYLYAVEKINRNKIYGVILCFTGVVIVTKDDTSYTNPSISNFLVFCGNMLALSGALIYGVYTILLKVKTVIKNSTLERQLNTHLFFGFVGVFCLVILWPVIIILHFTGVEPFELPSSGKVWRLVLVNMLITLISDFCWCKAVILTSPLTVTVGLSLTIPLAMVGDWFLKGFHLNWIYISGAAIVTVGFLIINNDEREEFTHNHLE